MVKAGIFLGDPRHVPGLAYAVGDCQAPGVSSTPLLSQNRYPIRW